MHLPPARTIALGTITADATAITGAGILFGYSFTETTGGAVAEVQLLDGTDTGGAFITDITLLADESTRDWFGLPGLVFRNSLFVDVVAGSVAGAVWVVPGEHVNAYILAQGLEPIWRGSE
jgi:hypothetical protein